VTVVSQLPACHEVNGSKGLSIVVSQFQTMANEDIEDLVDDVVRSRVHELVSVLYLLSVKIYESGKSDYQSKPPA
jgi:hypothetical protein